PRLTRFRKGALLVGLVPRFVAAVSGLGLPLAFLETEILGISDRRPVTSEVAGSSPVVRAILFNNLPSFILPHFRPQMAVWRRCALERISPARSIAYCPDKGASCGN